MDAKAGFALEGKTIPHGLSLIYEGSQMVYPIFILSWAVLLSATAAYFSIVGLAELFSAAFYPVMVMGVAIEGGKLIAASILHRNWHNPEFPSTLKKYLVSAVVAGMIVTALGIYGFLAKGHMAQEAPLAANALVVERIEQKIAALTDEASRYQKSLSQLDAMVQVLIDNDNIRGRNGAASMMAAQEQQRTSLLSKIDTVNKSIDEANADLLETKSKTAGVTAKLGPIKYVAELFGWHDPASAVKLVIIIIMWCFDPLAIVLVISGSIELGKLLKSRHTQAKEQVEDNTQHYEDKIKELAGIIANLQASSRIDKDNYTELANTVSGVSKAFPHASKLMLKPLGSGDTVVSEREMTLMLLEQYPDIVSDMIAAVSEINAVNHEARLTPDVPNDTEPNLDENPPETEVPKPKPKRTKTTPGNEWIPSKK